MRVLLLFCILLGLALSDPDSEWKTFKSRHGKKYGSTKEETKRKNIYLKNKKMIDEHNAKYSQGLTTYTMAMNDLGDLEPHELMFGNNNSRKAENATRLTLTASFTATPPTSKDWRSSGVVTSVKDQGQCGSCWAFAANGAVESAYLIKYKYTYDLSEQNLVDCTNNWSWGNYGCNGGWVTNAFNYMRYNGVNTETYYPYTAKNGSCRYSSSYVGARVTGWYKVRSGDETSLMTAVGTVGPVTVSVDATSFQFYSGGVFNPSSCSTTRLNHAILAVGYGTTSTGQAYWIVKNSWGTNWGQQGYIFMSRNKGNQCGIASDAYYPVV